MYICRYGHMTYRHLSITLVTCYQQMTIKWLHTFFPFLTRQVLKKSFKVSSVCFKITSMSGFLAFFILFGQFQDFPLWYTTGQVLTWQSDSLAFSSAKLSSFSSSFIDKVQYSLVTGLAMSFLIDISVFSTMVKTKNSFMISVTNQEDVESCWHEVFSGSSSEECLPWRATSANKDKPGNYVADLWCKHFCLGFTI